MKTILAATDFSPSSLNACRYAAMLANKMKCKLTILNLFDVPVVHSNSGLYFMSFQSVLKDHGKSLQKLETNLHQLYAHLTIDSVVSTGSLKNEVQQYIESHQILAVVMGLSAKTQLERTLQGSHSTDLAGKISAPVIIVPEKYKIHHLRSIVLGVDNKDKLFHAKLTQLESIVKFAKARLTLLHVKTENEIFSSTQGEIIINHKKHKVITINDDSTQKGLLSYAKNFEIDMIALISKKHSIFYEMFSETHTKQIAFESKIPVMALHE